MTNAVSQSSSVLTGLQRLVIAGFVVLAGAAMAGCRRGGDAGARMRAVADRADRGELGSDAAAKELAQIAKNTGGTSEIVEALRKDGDPTHSYWWTALALLGPEASSAIPFLIECLESGPSYRSEYAAMVLGKMGGGASSAVPALCKGAASGDALLRWYATQALGDIGATDPNVIDVLRRGEKDEDVMVRCYARAVLLKLGYDNDTLAYLVKRLRESDPEVRNAAVLALGYLGPKASAAIPELGLLLEKEDNVQVKENAEEAVKKISGEF